MLKLLFSGKVVGREVVDQLQMFMEESPILNPFQTGFCPGCELETALVASEMTSSGTWIKAGHCCHCC